MLTLVLAISCARPVDRQLDRQLDRHESAVVFGSDDRREPHEVDTVHAEIAREQVAVRIVDWAVDLTEPSTPRITYERTLGESLDLCEGEPFADQIAPGSCSATLIDERHLLTAGHCVGSAAECTESHYWVFGFYVDETGEHAPLDADDVYQCARVVVSNERDDYSIFELDRDVRGREPVEVALHEGGLPLGTSVTLVGFPDGIPVKVDSGGVVVYSALDRYFRATVDAFDSSSGSGVFDDEGRLVGILQRGHPDYVAHGDCNVVNVLDSMGDEGEVVGYPDPAMIAYCAIQPESGQCACDGPCWMAAADAGMDAELADASVLDASVLDAASLDAHALDAGTPDRDSGCAVGAAMDGAWLLLLALLAIRPRA